jgi:hypothetical protein
MGFGTKTDYATGRILDLNKSYNYIIKPTVESRGLICIRADEVLHSGSIDFEMYKELYNADLVIADLSTANVNAFYELGIRHALKRRTTIVISEDKLNYPFDLNHVKIMGYTHLGTGIDFEEVNRFKKLLGDTIDAMIDLEDPPDSPVYTHLNELTPPMLHSEKSTPFRKLKFVYRAKRLSLSAPEATVKNFSSASLGSLIDQGEAAFKERNYPEAKILFDSAFKVLNDESYNDPYLVQRMAHSTYKAKLPDQLTALQDAKMLLSKLDLEHTNDTESVTLAGRIEKKLYEKGQGEIHLTSAIQYFERGYFLLQNRYHGNNLAFLYNMRADSGLLNTNEDRIADLVWANRIRNQVLKMCEIDLIALNERKKRIAEKISLDNSLRAEYDATEDMEQFFWIHANKAEALYGLGEIGQSEKTMAEAMASGPTDWMMQAYEADHNKLKELMENQGHLLNPPWSAI